MEEMQREWESMMAEMKKMKDMVQEEGSDDLKDEMGKIMDQANKMEEMMGGMDKIAM